MRRLAYLTALSAWLAVSASQAATINVQITGVEGELRDNVAAYLSLKRFADAKDLSQEQVDRLALRARREAIDALKPFGYYQARTTTTVTRGKDGWTAVVAVEPGEPVVLTAADVRIEGPGRDEPYLAAALKGSPLAVGKRLSHADYDQLKGNLQKLAVSHGYLDASWSRAELRVDIPERSAQALLTLDTGDRYRFGKTTVDQQFLNAGFVRRYLRYHEGDWYDAALLLRTQFALDDSDYFAVVEVLPEQRDPEARTIPVRISAERNKRYRYEAGVGYATDTGARVTLGVTARQLNRYGHRLAVGGSFSSLVKTANLNYIIPWDDPALEKLSFKLSGGLERQGDVETRGLQFSPSLTQVRGRWQRVLFAQADYSRDVLRGPPPETGNPINENRHFLLVPGVSFALLPQGFINADAAGRGLYAELLGSTGTLGSDADFLRLLVRDERRLDLGGPWHLVLRGEFGTSAVGNFQDLPSQYRFFAGGDRSVRGYSYDELSPVDAAGNKIGGRHLLVGSVEVEHDLPRNLAIAVFVDGGNAFNRFGDPLQYSAGFGIRYRLPFVMVGIDVARSISESGRSPRFHMNFAPLL